MLLATVVFATSCGRGDDTDVRQDNAFKTYITGGAYTSELPADSLGGVWRVLENDREGRNELALPGAEVDIYFEGYIFYSSINLDPHIEMRPAPFYTNRKAIADGMGVDWPVEPVVARLGSGMLFEGLDRGLQGACKGDSLLLFITSRNGYGEDGLALVPDNAPLVYRVFINDVR